MKLRALKAEHGDAFILSTNNAQILIDGGASGTYQRSLRPSLEMLPDRRIDLAMVSHIDSDHIDGILDLVAEMDDDKADRRQTLVNIREVWHNSFSDLIASKDETEEDTTIATSASARMQETDDQATLLPQMVLSSVAEGRKLANMLAVLNIEVNKKFQNKLVVRDGEMPSFMYGNIKLQVLGPTEKELAKLRKDWKKKLKGILSKETAEAASIFDTVKLDRSVSNLASLVVMAQGDGKRILLTGDARGDMILEWLEQTGQLDANGFATFDLLKLPHHGSRRNLSPEFFQRIKADKYLISGNGHHGNPEPGVFEWLFAARPELGFKIYLTYSPNEIKSRKAYIKRGYHTALDQVLSDKKRQATLEWPKKFDEFIDIEI